MCQVSLSSMMVRIKNHLGKCCDNCCNPFKRLMTIAEACYIEIFIIFSHAKLKISLFFRAKWNYKEGVKIFSLRPCRRIGVFVDHKGVVSFVGLT